MLRNARRFFSHRSASHPPVFVFAVVIFFWTLADATGQYVAPLLMEQHGFSNTMIGFILGASSLAGGAFDFLVCLVFRNTDFRRLFLVTLALCLSYPVFLSQADTLWLFLFAMAVWGVYFDLYNISTFDFISRYTARSVHASGFGVIQTLRALGLLIAPLLIGFVVAEAVDWRAFALYWVYIAASIIIFLALLYIIRSSALPRHENRRKNIFIELHLWRKLVVPLFPTLLVTIYLFSVEAFFWTLAPLYAQSVSVDHFGGILLMAYTFPFLTVGWFIGSLTVKYGTQRTAYIALFLGSAVLSLFILVPEGYLVVALVLVASFFISMAIPAINAAYADYIASDAHEEGEIETLEDFAANIGYFVGPVSAGILADLIGMRATFSSLGFAGMILATALLFLFIRKVAPGRKRAG